MTLSTIPSKHTYAPSSQWLFQLQLRVTSNQSPIFTQKVRQREQRSLQAEKLFWESLTSLAVTLRPPDANTLMNFIAVAQATPWRLVSKHPGSATWGSHWVGRNSLTMVSINRGQSRSCRETAGSTNNLRYAIMQTCRRHAKHTFVWSLCHHFTCFCLPFFKPFSTIPELLYNGRFTWLHASEECLAMWVRMCSISRTTVGTGRTTSRMYLRRCWIRVFRSPWKGVGEITKKSQQLFS